MKSDRQQDIHTYLIERCLKKDTKAQYQIYKLYADAMFNVSRRMLRNEEDARDILQEAFVDAFSKLHTFRFDSSFGSWLKRIVINKSINFINKKKLLTTELEKVNHLDLAEEIEEDFEWDVEVGMLRKAIKKLPLGAKTVLNLYLFEGYDHQEIAAILSVSVSTSKAQYSKAKKKLRSIVSTMFDQQKETNYGR